MAVWNKPPEQSPQEIARIQAQIDADPVVQAFRASGYRQPNDQWTRDPKSGRVLNPDQLRDYIRKKYGLPDGYDVSQQGQVVYTNETPWLKQATMAAAPVAIPMTLSAAGIGVPSVAGATGQAAQTAQGMSGTPGLDTGQGVNAGGWNPGSSPLADPNPNPFGGGISTPPLGGVRPPSAGGGDDLSSRLRDWFTDPRNIIGLAGMAGSLATRPNGGMSADQQAAQAQANRMAAITEARMRRVDPLHQAVTQLAFGRLPVSSRNGIALNNVPLPE